MPNIELGAGGREQLALTVYVWVVVFFEEPGSVEKTNGFEWSVFCRLSIPFSHQQVGRAFTYLYIIVIFVRYCKLAVGDFFHVPQVQCALKIGMPSTNMQPTNHKHGLFNCKFSSVT